MINRELIRLKVVQLVYAFNKDEGKSLEIAEKELAFSLNKAYDLYLYLLSLLIELRKHAERKDAVRIAREKRIGSASNEKTAEWLVAENKFLKQLEGNKTLIDYIENKKGEWTEESAIVRKLFTQLTESDFFGEYQSKEHPSYDDDRELVRKFYKTCVCNNDDLDSSIEDHSIYWNDDKDIVDSFVLKTIKRLNAEDGPETELLPIYAADEDQEFGQKLFHAAVVRGDEWRELIKASAKNWDAGRMAFMDFIIMQIALAEIITFESIPLNVTFSEYLDIARIYSTPQSASFINGILENVVRNLQQEGRIEKKRLKK